MQTNLETTLSQLISIPSAANQPGAYHDVIAFVRDELASYNLFVHEDHQALNPWLLATTKDTLEPDILLVAHLDVVPASDDMFTMRKQDDKLYGRGVFDMKFAAACYLEFFKNHADKLPGLNIGVLFTTDEETGSDSMDAIMATGLRPKVVFLPDGGDNWAIEKRAKGFYAVELTAQGKAAHGSRPWEGNNAVHTLIDTMQILRAEYPLQNPSDPTLQVNMLQAGEAVNQIPSSATARIDFRAFDPREMQECQDFITEFAREHDLEMIEIKKGDPVIFDEAAPAVQSFLQAFRSHLEVADIPFSDSYGGTDARFFVAYDIPCIIVEPHGGGRHSSDEWLQASDLNSYYQLIEHWILDETHA